MLSRRQFLQTSLATSAAGLGLGGYTWLIEPHWLEIVRRPLPIAGLPPAMAGLQLAHLTDIHVGRQVSDDYIRETFHKVAALNPDIVVYTGDFTTHGPGIFEHAERMYQDLPRGRLATLGVLGNHDYGPNWAHPEVAARFTGILADSGMRILRNEVADVEGLQVMGMDDYWANQFDPARAVGALDSSRAAIALTHNPDSADLPGWRDYHGWILCGHTHGGQCKPPFLPPPMLPVKNRRYTAGEFALEGERQMYINRGVGHIQQVRFNVRPEVTLFELECA
ncbi:MAG: metallophosphoesterase [Gemmatimonadota bacterium]|nr:metallophosphoesterase [Gemmatimonadota bacterium]